MLADDEVELNGGDGKDQPDIQAEAEEKDAGRKDSAADISIAISASCMEEDSEEEEEAERERAAAAAGSPQAGEVKEVKERAWRCRKFLRGYCRSRARTATSALPPVPFRCKDRDVRYLITGINNPSGYHGVDFCWSLQAHTDRIVTCITTKQGCVTSGADMLVKMWNYSGAPLGVLMQSVPVGRRSMKWDCMLDAAGIMRNEGLELDAIIEEVKDLVTSEKPDIYDMDFTTMEPGANAEDFTRSDLRQRIELTSSKLGIDFPTEGESALARSQLDMDEFDAFMQEEVLQADAASQASSHKMLDAAMMEIRSTSSKKVTKIDFTKKQETDMQRKRREKKFEETSSKYEKLGGMKVGPPGTESGVLDRDINLAEIQAMSGHGADTDASTQRDARDKVGGEAGTAEASGLDDGCSVDFNDLDSLVSSLGLPGSVQGLGESLARSIDLVASKGRRTRRIAKTCAKYDHWDKLESALKSSTKQKPGGVPPRSADYIAKQRAKSPSGKKRPPKLEAPDETSVITEGRQ